MMDCSILSRARYVGQSEMQSAIYSISHVQWIVSDEQTSHETLMIHIQFRARCHHRTRIPFIVLSFHAGPSRFTELVFHHSSVRAACLGSYFNHPFIKITCVCLSEAILNSAINPPASSDIQPKWWVRSTPPRLYALESLGVRV
jgi:hypothetical protein